MSYLQPSIDSLYPNTAGITIGLPNSSNKGFDIKAGIIESNPNVPYNPNNNMKFYDSKDRYNHIPSAKAHSVLYKLRWLYKQSHK